MGGHPEADTRVDDGVFGSEALEDAAPGATHSQPHRAWLTGPVDGEVTVR